MKSILDVRRGTYTNTAYLLVRKLTTGDFDFPFDEGDYHGWKLRNGVSHWAARRLFILKQEVIEATLEELKKPDMQDNYNWYGMLCTEFGRELDPNQVVSMTAEYSLRGVRKEETKQAKINDAKAALMHDIKIGHGTYLIDKRIDNINRSIEMAAEANNREFLQGQDKWLRNNIADFTDEGGDNEYLVNRLKVLNKEIATLKSVLDGTRSDKMMAYFEEQKWENYDLKKYAPALIDMFTRMLDDRDINSKGMFL